MSSSKHRPSKPLYKRCCRFIKKKLQVIIDSKQFLHEVKVALKEKDFSTPVKRVLHRLVEMIITEPAMRFIHNAFEHLLHMRQNYCSLTQLMSTIFIIFLCQWRAGKSILPDSGTAYDPDSKDRHIMATFKRCSIFAKAAYCNEEVTELVRKPSTSARPVQLTVTDRPNPTIKIEIRATRESTPAITRPRVFEIQEIQGKTFETISYHNGKIYSSVYCESTKWALAPIKEALRLRRLAIERKTEIVKGQMAKHFENLKPPKVFGYVDGESLRGEKGLQHFVAINYQDERVVLSFKGTSGMESIFKDLDAKYETFEFCEKKYKVHRGMYNAAKDFLNEQGTMETIRRALKDHPTYTLTLVGHSLGGGVAALVTVLLSKKRADGGFESNIHDTKARPIECYTIGPAACMNSDLASDTKSMIHTLINGYDVVPYLSTGVLVDLCTSAKELHAKENFELFSEIVEAIVHPLKHADKKKYIDLLKPKDGVRSERLVPPGRVWVIVYNEEDGDNCVEGLEEVVNVKERFGYINLMQGYRMVQDHSLGDLGDLSKKLDKACEAMRKQSS